MLGIGKTIREKWVHCGNDYNEFYIYHKNNNNPPARRNRRHRDTAPAQKNLNDKQSRRHFIRLAYGNFGWKDYHITATYDDEYLPLTWEDALRDARNYMKRIVRRCKKLGLPPPKYLGVVECYDKNGKPCRIHLHILISCELSRDELESLWHKKGMKKGKTLGFVNVDKIRMANNGIERLARYITKYPDKAGDTEDAEELKNLHKRPHGQRRWFQSLNLTIPFSTYADKKYKPSSFKKSLDRYRDKEYWEELYPGFRYLFCTREKSDISGWCICLKMQRITS